MSKRSRTFQPSATRPEPADGSSSGVAPATPPEASTPVATATPTTPGTGSRTEARRRASIAKAAPEPSLFDRYKVLILGGAGVLVVLLGVLFLTRSSTQAYECVTFLTPPPGSPASPAPGQSPLLGFQTQDVGREHTVQNATVRYAYCPPASGGHYNLGGGRGPLARRFFGPTDNVIPPEWIHNLEHGYVLLLYRGDPGAQALDQLRAVMDEAAVSAWASQNCGPVNKVIALRFDDMDPSVNFAAVAWDRVLLLKELDQDQLLAFANQWQDGPQTPERVCG